MSFALSVLPLLLIIAAGYGLARSGVLPSADWKGIETLSFRVLIPAVLVLAITQTDLSWDLFGGFITTVIATFVAVSMLCLLTRLMPQSRLSNPAFTSVFQAGSRWNAFVALAAAEQFLGDQGLAAMAVAIAVLIPTINITCIIVLTTFGPERATVGGILKTVLQNPLVQACAIGLLVYFSGVALPPPVIEALDMIGRGALAVGLMAIGAGISLRRLLGWDWRLGVALVLRPMLAPALFAGIAIVIGLDATLTLVGVLIFAAPAATNGYIVAKKMGGDADLYADILTWQTFLSLVVLPIWAWLLMGQT